MGLFSRCINGCDFGESGEYEWWTWYFTILVRVEYGGYIRVCIFVWYWEGCGSVGFSMGQGLILERELEITRRSPRDFWDL